MTTSKSYLFFAAHNSPPTSQSITPKGGSVVDLMSCHCYINITYSINGSVLIANKTNVMTITCIQPSLVYISLQISPYLLCLIITTLHHPLKPQHQMSICRYTTTNAKQHHAGQTTTNNNNIIQTNTNNQFPQRALGESNLWSLRLFVG